MGLFDKIFNRKEIVVPVPETEAKKPARKKKVAAETNTSAPAKKPAAKKPARKKKAAPVIDAPQTDSNLAKDAATAKGEAWVSVVDVEIDSNHVSNGSFTLDWNDFFIAKLIRAGYKGKDVEIVDQWFSDVCRNIIQENYEQSVADPDKRA